MGNQTSQKRVTSSSLSTSQLLQRSYTTYDSRISDQQYSFTKQKKKCCICFTISIDPEHLGWIDEELTYLEKRTYRNQSWNKCVKESLINLDRQYNIESIQDQKIAQLQEIIDHFHAESITSRIFSQQISQFPQEEIIEYTNEAYAIIDDKKYSRLSEQEFYKQIMKKVQQHLREKQNPCGDALRSFQLFFINYKGYSFRDSLRLSIKRNSKNESTLLCDEIKSFVQFLVYSIMRFYKLEIIIKDQRFLNCFTETNLSSYVLTLLFQDEKIYYKIFDSFSQYYNDENTLYLQNINKLSSEQPSYFDIPSYLELQQQNPSIDIPEKSNPSVQMSSQIEYQPYDSVINMLKKIEQSQSPTQQLNIIAWSIDEIRICIDKYYEFKDLDQKIKFGADELVPLLIYIIIKSSIPDLGIILKLIETFTPKNIMKSQLGCKLVTLQNCYEHIINFRFSDNKKYNFKSEFQIQKKEKDDSVPYFSSQYREKK